MNQNKPQEFNQDVNQLSREIQPERDLWPGIEAAITQSPMPSSSSVKRMTPWFATAASLVFAAILGVMYWQQTKISSTSLLASMERQHQQSMQRLLVSYEDQPAATDNWQAQLADLDSAAQAIRQVLKEEPNNPELLRMLRHVYQQQLQLIEKVHQPRWQSL